MYKQINFKRLVFCSVVAFVLAFSAIPFGSIAINGENSSYAANAAAKNVNIEITSWKIKSTSTAKADLNQMGKTSFLTRVPKKNKHAKKISDRYFITGQDASLTFYPTGWSYPLHTKVGTAKLKSKAPANMVIRSEFMREKERFYSETLSSYLIVCYKGSATADIYSHYMVNLYKKGKNVKIDGTKYTLAKAKKYKYGKKYNTVHYIDGKMKSKNRILFMNDEPTNEFTYYKAITGGGYGTWSEISEKTVPAEIWYGNKMTKVNLTLTAPTINKAISIKVQNKKAKGFSVKADKKNAIYKAGHKEMKKKKSSSCDQTAANIYSKAKAGTPIFNFPLNDLKTGDMIYEPGHVGVFAGSGKQFNGSVTYKKTYISNGPVYGCTHISRTPYAFFRYHK